ncbi:hypothetical protein CHARACLAT_003921 [Characodon lateralis]|uniref:Uncharacterized protein n=1 Tax=Characodon lateralis TaxID=208331 RepID=A0ABU7CY08_9TELE|nr:hypothetical protein [Characodon lateralis]
MLELKMALLSCFLNMEGEHEDHTDQTMKVLVIHNPLAKEDPAEVSVVIEGNRLPNGCGNRTKTCMLLMGLIYGLNLEYPKMLKNTFAVFQKIFLELDGAKLPRKVQILPLFILSYIYCFFFT